MSDHARRDHLLHGRLDGALSPGEQQELAQLLADDAAARGRAADLDALDQALSALGPVDPPADLVGAFEIGQHQAGLDHVDPAAGRSWPRGRRTPISACR